MGEYKVIKYDVDISPNELISGIEGAIGENILGKALELWASLSFVTGCAGIEKIVASDKIVHNRDSKLITVKSSWEYSVELSHLNVLDSSILDSRTHKAYPLSSYTILVLWGEAPIAVLKAEYPSITR